MTAPTMPQKPTPREIPSLAMFKDRMGGWKECGKGKDDGCCARPWFCTSRWEFNQSEGAECAVPAVGVRTWMAARHDRGQIAAVIVRPAALSLKRCSFPYKDY